MSVISTIYAPAMLTVHRISGPFDGKDLSDTLHEFYREIGPTNDVLWDARRVRWDHESAASVLAAIKEGLHIYETEMLYRKGGKTAVVVGSKPMLSLAVIAQQLMEDHEPPLGFQLEVFTDMKRATAWLTRTPVKVGQTATEIFGKPVAGQLIDLDEELSADEHIDPSRPTH